MAVRREEQIWSRKSWVVDGDNMHEDEKTVGPRLPEGILLEGIVTTRNADGSPHVAPMGPIVNAEFTRILLRPFPTSTTYENLKRSKAGVLHVTDDVELFARAAVGELRELPRMFSATAVDGVVLAEACRWYAFRVNSIDDRAERTEMQADVVESGRVRDFFGFNRGKHAVIEAAILATRVNLLDANEITNEFARLKTAIEKTGGRQEHAAYAFLKAYVEERLATAAKPERR